MSDSIYTEVSGTTVIIDERRGTATSFRYSPIDQSIEGVFVAWDEGGMAYVATGRHTGEQRPSGHYTHREIESVRDIDRDEFDVLTGLAGVRRKLGWRA